MDSHGLEFFCSFKNTFSFKSKASLNSGFIQLQQAIQEYPVILLPNHRSYMDFMVLSYIMFTYDLSIPVIAAGIRKYLLIFNVIVGGKIPQSHYNSNVKCN